MYCKSIDWFLSDGEHRSLMGYKPKYRKEKRKKTPRKLVKGKRQKKKKEDNCNEITNRNDKNKTNVYVLGDSMVKKLNRYLFT